MGRSVCAKRGCSATRELEWMESCIRGGEGASGVVLQHAPPWAFCIVKNKYELCTVRGVEEKNLKNRLIWTQRR